MNEQTEDLNNGSYRTKNMGNRGRLYPGEKHRASAAMTSHEAMCFLNAGERDAHIRVTIFFEDREPVGPYTFTVGARRTHHVRFNNLKDPEEIPRDTAYSSLIESDEPVVVQHTRLDSRQGRQRAPQHDRLSSGLRCRESFCKVVRRNRLERPLFSRTRFLLLRDLVSS